MCFALRNDVALFGILKACAKLLAARNTTLAAPKTKPRTQETAMSAMPDSVRGAAANDADAQETREWLDALAGRHLRLKAPIVLTSC